MNEILQEEPKKINIKKMIFIILLVLILFIIGVTILLYCFYSPFKKWVDNKIFLKTIYQGSGVSIEFSGEKAQVFALDKYIVVIQEKSLHFYNSLGEEVKTIGIEINEAIWDISGKYAVISEKNGRKMYVITGKDITWQNELEDNILQVSINENGYVAAVTTDVTYKNIVSVFDNKGKEILKTYLANTKVVDISLSTDNKYLAIAEVDMTGVLIQSSIKIVSIETAKVNPSAAIVYKYSADENKLIVKIHYQNKGRLVCMYNNSIDILENNSNSELVNIDNRSISYATVGLKNNVCFVEEVSSGEYTSNTSIKILNITNKKQKEYKVDKVAKEIYYSDNVVGLNFGSEIYVVNKNGWLLKQYISNQEINSFIMSDKIAGVVYRNEIEVFDL